jgi:type I restriction enzyme S subunit
MVKVNCVCTTPERWSGSDSSALEIRYVDIGGVDRLDRRIASASTLLAADAPSRAQWVLNEGDVLVATVRPNLNAVCRIPPEFAGAIGSNGFAALRPNAALLDSWYLYFWTRSPSFIDMLVRRATGAAYPAVSLADVESLQIPLPPLDEQRRIADILDAADALRRKRREALRLLDELQRATFLEMFGDPVTNPKGWPVARIGNVCRVTTGNTPSREVSGNFGDAIEWLKSDNLGHLQPSPTRATEGLSQLGAAAGRTCPAATVLVCCIAGSRDSIGKTSLLDRPAAFNQQINGLEAGPGLEPAFLYGLLRTGKALVQNQSTDGMKGIVTKGRLEDVEIPVPPLTQQEEFSSAFRRWAATCTDAQQALSTTETLFAALLDRAFRGEL